MKKAEPVAVVVHGSLFDPKTSPNLHLSTACQRRLKHGRSQKSAALCRMAPMVPTYFGRLRSFVAKILQGGNLQICRLTTDEPVRGMSLTGPLATGSNQQQGQPISAMPPIATEMVSAETDEKGESREGISPPRAPKTCVNLSIHTASDCSASDIHEPPMSKEVWIGTANPSQPISCAFGSFAQALVLSARPAD